MDTVYLQGSEAVARAGNRMQSAGDDIARAASTIDSAVFTFSQQVNRLEVIMSNVIEAMSELKLKKEE